MINNNPASFLLRWLANIAEGSFGLLLSMIFVVFVVSQPTLSAAAYVLAVFLILYFLNPLIIYNSIVLTHYFGGSLGKLLTGLQVVNETGSPLSLKRIAFRQTIGYSFASMVFGLGFLAIIKDPKKQGWHDKAVSSQVIVKQNLWPVALIFTLLTLAGSVYLSVISVDRILHGSLYGEVKSIWQQMETERKAAEESAKKPPMISPTSLSPTTTIAPATQFNMN